MVATTPPSQPYIPWYRKLELPIILPSALLALVMVWSVVQSIATSNWADGLNVLVIVALPALLVGLLFARLHWLPGSLAHILSAILGVAWSVQCVGGLLINEIRGELGAPVAERLANWGDKAAEIAIRAIVLTRTVQAGGRGEDIVLFIVALALLMWLMGYATGWLLFRAHWTWPAVIINAVVILINYTFASPKPNILFFIFLGSALLLVVHQNIVQQERNWSASLIDFPTFMSVRFLSAAALFCCVVMLITSLLPGNVSSAQVARTWRVVSSPLTAMREGWEVAFSTINAPPGTSGGGFFTRSMRVGGGRILGDTIIMRVQSPKYEYWRAIARDRYSGRAWENTVGERARADTNTTTVEAARTPLEPGVIAIQPQDLQGRTLITQTVELAQERSDNLLVVAGQFVSSGLPVLVEHGFVDGDGNAAPNYVETSAIFSQVPLQQTQTYTVSSLASTADVQSLREAGTGYPDWIRSFYLQIPDTVTQRTRDLAQKVVGDVNATNPYDQAEAIQNYLRRFVYDERRPLPPENRDWADYFLFESKSGYCDDFATSMIVMLRSLGVPARLAQGYAGGTPDPDGSGFVVRESVAHSWPEVYFPGFGWQRFEPTPASYTNVPARPSLPEGEISPSSIVPGSAELPDFLRDRLEDENAADTLSAEDLEASRQAALARQQAEQQRQMLLMMGVLLALAGFVALLIYRMNRELRGLSPAAAAYTRLGRMASWAGLRQEQHLTPHEYGQFLSEKLPDQRGPVERIVGAYVSERYKPDASPRGIDFEPDIRAVRKPLLGRIFTQFGSDRSQRKVTLQRRKR